MSEAKTVKDWISFARMDLSAAIYLQGHSPLPIEMICYHCQQAAEKALKAVLASHDADIPRIHDLTKLLATAAQCDNSMPRHFSSPITAIKIIPLYFI
jgi:HEPN domain-containing protein